MLVPDIPVVPPPSRVERIPTDEAKQRLVTFSLSAPGAETVTPIPVLVEGPVGGEVRGRVFLDDAPVELAPGVRAVNGRGARDGQNLGVRRWDVLRDHVAGVVPRRGHESTILRDQVEASACLSKSPPLNNQGSVWVATGNSSHLRSVRLPVWRG